MAGDLTPADEPRQPDPADLVPVAATEVEVLDPDADAGLPALASGAEGGQRDPHGRRFRLAYFLLAIIGGAALVSAVALAWSSGPGAPEAWSSFVPSGSGIDRATSIAAYVAPRYLLDSGDELVAVQPTPAVYQGSMPIELVAVVTAAGGGTGGSGYDVIKAGPSLVSYQLCGLGDQCAIRSGDPSVERERLLRREALELALYTFKYIPDAETVVAYMPPPAGKKPTIALLFRKAAFLPQLQEPLDRTLTQEPVSPGLLATSPEKDVVEALTGRLRYGYAFSQLQDGNAALVLDPNAISA